MMFAGLGDVSAETAAPVVPEPAWSQAMCEKVFESHAEGLDDKYAGLFVGIFGFAGLFAGFVYAGLTRRPVGKWALGGTVLGAAGSAAFIHMNRYKSARYLYGDRCPGM
jgi:hypothetical protein